MEARAEELLDRPVYGMSQASRLLGLRADGLRRWIDGYERHGKLYAPVIRERRTLDDAVTWGEFIEAGYLREYRAKQVSLQYLRPVIGFLSGAIAGEIPVGNPAPTRQAKHWLSLHRISSGSDPELSIVVIERDGSLRLTDPAVAFLDKVEFDDAEGIARTPVPLGRKQAVVLDPHQSFGEPTVPAVGATSSRRARGRGRGTTARRGDLFDAGGACRAGCRLRASVWRLVPSRLTFPRPSKTGLVSTKQHRRRSSLQYVLRGSRIRSLPTVEKANPPLRKRIRVLNVKLYSTAGYEPASRPPVDSSICSLGAGCGSGRRSKIWLPRSLPWLAT